MLSVEPYEKWFRLILVTLNLKISTIEPEPGWDKEEPFPTYDQGVHTQYLESIRKLSDLLPQKAAIRIRG